MGDEHILPVIQPVTINTMLYNNGLNNSDGLNFVRCERSFTIHTLTLTRTVHTLMYKLSYYRFGDLQVNTPPFCTCTIYTKSTLMHASSH